MKRVARDGDDELGDGAGSSLGADEAGGEKRARSSSSDVPVGVYDGDLSAAMRQEEDSSSSEHVFVEMGTGEKEKAAEHLCGLEEFTALYAGQEQTKRLRQKMRERAAIIREGTEEIVMERVEYPPSPATVEAANFLLGLSEEKRCNFVLTVCEQLNYQMSCWYEFESSKCAFFKCIEGHDDEDRGEDLEDSEAEDDRWIVIRTMPIGDEAEPLDAIMRRVLESPCGGWRLVQEHLQECSFGHILANMQDFSMFTPFLREDQLAGSDSCLQIAQSDGFKSESPKILECLLKDQLYSARFNNGATVVTCRNQLGLDLLVAECLDPNSSDRTGTQALSYWEHTPEMFEAFVSAGARPELLNGLVVPSPRTLEKLLRLNPEPMKAMFPGERLLLGSHMLQLEYASVMRAFDYPTPEITIVGKKRDHIDFALFTFRFFRQPPPLVLGRCPLQSMLWRPHTHYACGSRMRRIVMAALMSFKRVCPRFSRDMRNVILHLAFEKVRFTPVLSSPQLLR